MSDLCIVKVLDYEAQQDLKKKKILECCNCPIKDNCKGYNGKENNHGIK